jgi:hypothetical protein
MKRITISLTEPQYIALISALEWIEAAGDYSEFAETQSTRDRTTYYRMLTVVRDAGTPKKAGG